MLYTLLYACTETNQRFWRLLHRNGGKKRKPISLAHSHSHSFYSWEEPRQKTKQRRPNDIRHMLWTIHHSAALFPFFFSSSSSIVSSPANNNTVITSFSKIMMMLPFSFFPSWLEFPVRESQVQFPTLATEAKKRNDYPTSSIPRKLKFRLRGYTEKPPNAATQDDDGFS